MSKRCLVVRCGLCGLVQAVRAAAREIVCRKCRTLLHFAVPVPLTPHQRALRRERRERKGVREVAMVWTGRLPCVDEMCLRLTAEAVRREPDLRRAATLIGVGKTTLYRWRKELAAGGLEQYERGLVVERRGAER